MTNKKMLKLVILLQIFIVGYSLQSYATDSARVQFGDLNIVPGESVSDVVVLFGDLTIEGNIEKNAVVIFGDMDLRQGGKVHKDAVVFGGNITFISPEQIAEDKVELSLGSIKPRDIFMGFLSLAILKSLAALVSKIFFFITSILLAFIFTRPLMAVGSALSSAPWKCGLIGILFWFCLPAAILLLILTIIGIFLMPLIIPFIFIIVIFSFASIAALIGAQIKLKNASPAMQIILGALIIFLLSLIPFAYYFVFLITVVMGTGAILFSKFGTKKPRFLG